MPSGYYDFALDLILDEESQQEDMLTEEQHEMVESAAELLYGLIHARFILTARGLAAMLEKLKSVEFGRCPRVLCAGQACLPVGQSDVHGQATVKIFCPKCEDLYFPRSKYQARRGGRGGCEPARGWLTAQPPALFPPCVFCWSGEHRRRVLWDYLSPPVPDDVRQPEARPGGAAAALRAPHLRVQGAQPKSVHPCHQCVGWGWCGRSRAPSVVSAERPARATAQVYTPPTPPPASAATAPALPPAQPT